MVKKAAPSAASTPVDPTAALDAIQRTEDLLDYTLRCVQAVTPEFGLHLPVVKSYLEQKLALTQYRHELEVRNRQIRQDAQRGDSYPLLMRRYNLKHAQVWRIVNGLSGP